MRRLTHLISALCLLMLIASPLGAALAQPEPPCIGPGCPLPPWPCPDCPPCFDCPIRHPFFPLAIQSLHVTVSIENQIATTHIEQVFRNDMDIVAEGTYLFPLPLGAAVSDFDMWVDGQKLEGKLLSATEARAIYDEIVRQQRDPALLEYVGQGALQANIFPVPPKSTRRVDIDYTEVLKAEQGLIHYRYPLNVAKFSTQPIEQLSISVKAASNEAVRAIYSPSHNVAIAREGETRFSAGYEANRILPDKDFDLFYSVSAEDIGLNLLTYRDPAGGDGFFVLLAAPSVTVDSNKVVAKDVLIVLDQSGSMEGEKFQQAQTALKYVLDHLNPADRFSIVAFSTGTQHYAPGLRPAADAPEASRWVDSLVAQGGTNINLALLEALGLADRERSTIVIFLTDGLATEGETGTENILHNVRQAAPSNVRLFAFGVGYDVDTILLDTLVEQNHGASSYVAPEARIDEAVSGFYAKVSTPVLSNVALDFGDVLVSDYYPNPLPDLFAGAQLVMVGRYRVPGTTAVKLSGLVNDQPQTFAYPAQTFTSAGGNNFIPQLWATRKIGYLLNQIRLHGENQEVIDQVVALSVRYGIVTPYTSYLVTEGAQVLSEEGRQQVAQDQFRTQSNAAPAPASGAGAVQKAQEQQALQDATTVQSQDEAVANVVQQIGGRTFLFADGKWVDTAFDTTKMKATPVEFASTDYFNLLSARPELASAFALGGRVIALAADGTAYEVVNTSTPTLTVPPTYTPAVVAQSTPVPVTTVVGNPPAATPVPAGQTPPSNGICNAPYFVLGLVALPFLARKRRKAGVISQV